MCPILKQGFGVAGRKPCLQAMLPQWLTYYMPVFSNQQDHQRWGYSTVTHMEQPVYLAIWKDLNKKKRKEHRKKIEP